MSPREKNLLTLLLSTAFIILNFFLYSLYIQKKNQLATLFATTTSSLQIALNNQEMSAQLAEQIAWLAENQPPPIAYQEIQTNLQKFAETQAQNLGLTIKRQELLPTDTTGTHFHRAQVKIDLTGPEPALYRWLDAINAPTALRTASQIRISPNTDDTLIDCSATLAQWFPPAP